MLSVLVAVLEVFMLDTAIVGAGLYPLLPQPACHLFSVPNRQHIDDPSTRQYWNMLCQPSQPGRLIG